MNGEVIGVNTAIYTQSAGYQGIGFAMPSNTVVSVYNDLISPSHKVTRGSIGIQFREGLSGAVNRVYGFKNGVLVQEVQPGGPADKAGIKAGDIITTIDGRPIKDGDDLVNEIASRAPGSSIRLGYMRDGKPQDTTVTIGDRDKVFADLNNPQPESDQENGGGAGEAKLGVVVQDASAGTWSIASKLPAWSSSRFAPVPSLTCRDSSRASSSRTSTGSQPPTRSSLMPSSANLRPAMTWSLK